MRQDPTEKTLVQLNRVDRNVGAPGPDMPRKDKSVHAPIEWNRVAGRGAKLANFDDRRTAYAQPARRVNCCVNALDRVHSGLAENRDGQDPALEAARGKRLAR